MTLAADLSRRGSGAIVLHVLQASLGCLRTADLALHLLQPPLRGLDLLEVLQAALRRYGLLGLLYPPLGGFHLLHPALCILGLPKLPHAPVRLIRRTARISLRLV